MSLLVVLMAQSCKPGYQEKLAAVNTETVAKVEVVNLQPKTEPIPVYASGVLASKAQALLSFKIGGVIQEILVDEGQSFRKGDALARLELNEISARVKQAQEGVDKLNRDLGRVERLYADSVATLEQVQDLKTALSVAEQDLTVAKYNQQYAVIVAKENGKVLRRMGERGELASPGKPIFQVSLNGRSKSHIIKIGIADRDVVKTQLGDSATLSFDVYPDRIFKASVSEIAESANPRTGTFEVELTLEATRVMLKDGFVAKLKLYPSRQETYYQVPMAALVEGDENEAVVYLPSDRSVKAVAVKPTSITDEFFIVTERELGENPSVVTSGASYAEPGEPIEILNR